MYANKSVVVLRRDKKNLCSFINNSVDASRKMKYELKSNLGVLGFDFAFLTNNTGDFIFDALDKPSRKIFEITIHFLFSKIDEKCIQYCFKGNIPNNPGEFL